LNLPLRQRLGLVDSLLWLTQLDMKLPDFITVCRLQKTLKARLPYRFSTGALVLLVGITVILFLVELE